MSRPEVGVIKCPFTGELSVVRADCRGKLYYYSQAGKIAPNLPQGQAWLSKNQMPLTDFEITVVAVGAPPVVKKKALTEQGEQTRDLIPLTEKDSPKVTGTPKSIMEFFS